MDAMKRGSRKLLESCTWEEPRTKRRASSGGCGWQGARAVQFSFPLSRNLLGTGKKDPQDKQEIKMWVSKIQKNQSGQREQEAARCAETRLRAPCSG